MKKYASWIIVAFLLIVSSACSSASTPTVQVPEGPGTPSATPFRFPATFTPTMTGPPPATHTPFPSRTPKATSTLAPTIAPSLTPAVSILLASDQNQPAISQDLVYFKNDQPFLWSKAGGPPVRLGEDVLPADLAHSTASDNQTLMAFAGTDSEGQNEVLIYDRLAGLIVHTIPFSESRILDLEISSNGSWLGLVVQEIVNLPVPTQTITPGLTLTPGANPGATPTLVPATATPGAGPTSTPGLMPTATEFSLTATPTITPTATPIVAPPEEGISGAVLLFRIGGVTPPREVGSCGQKCTGIAWSPTDSDLLWSDSEGVWRFRIGQQAMDAQVLLPPYVSGVSGFSQTTDSYLPLSWSTSGRFLLLRKGLEQGLIYSVLDTFTGVLENLPGSGVYSGPLAGFAWLAGDILLIARPGVESQELLPAAELWALTPGAGSSLFEKVGETIFPGDFNTVPAAPQQLQDGRVGFSLINFRDANDTDTNGLYILDPAAGVITKYNTLPFARVLDTYWLADGSGVLVETASRILFVPGAGDILYSLLRFLGEPSCCYEWVLD